MPGLDGPRLYAHLMSERPALATRIIFMTGDTSSTDTMAFLERTGRRYITKPFDVVAVTSLVSESLAAMAGGAK